MMSEGRDGCPKEAELEASMAGVTAHTWIAEAKGPPVEGQPGLLSETLCVSKSVATQSNSCRWSPHLGIPGQPGVWGSRTQDHQRVLVGGHHVSTWSAAPGGRAVHST